MYCWGHIFQCLQYKTLSQHYQSWIVTFFFWYCGLHSNCPFFPPIKQNLLIGCFCWCQMTVTPGTNQPRGRLTHWSCCACLCLPLHLWTPVSARFCRWLPCCQLLHWSRLLWGPPSLAIGSGTPTWNTPKTERNCCLSTRASPKACVLRHDFGIRWAYFSKFCCTSLFKKTWQVLASCSWWFHNCF